MAAENKLCFEKKCICATCQNICSRCMIQNDECESGVRNCTSYNGMSFEEYKSYNKYTRLTKEEYNLAVRKDK